MSKKVLIPIADGTEELEAVTLVDVLRRAEMDVTVASVGALQVTASRGVNIVADCIIDDCLDETYDMIVLPGGIPGAENLRDSKALEQLLRKQHEAHRMIGAICASPAVVLATHGLVSNTKATCYPSFMEKLTGARKVDSPVVTDKTLVTSQGPGTALAFSLKIVGLLLGKESAEGVAKAMLTSVPS
jgi:4-methyl-5(b-hydroxyethyl)-thiazole monophosphate biosynthesis